MSADQLPPEHGAFITHFKAGGWVGFQHHGQKDLTSPTAVIATTVYRVDPVTHKLKVVYEKTEPYTTYYDAPPYLRADTDGETIIEIGSRSEVGAKPRCSNGVMIWAWAASEFVIVSSSYDRHALAGHSAGLEIFGDNKIFLWNYTTTRAGLITPDTLETEVLSVGAGGPIIPGAGAVVGGLATIEAREGFYGHFPSMEQGLFEPNIGIRTFIEPSGRLRMDCQILPHEPREEQPPFCASDYGIYWPEAFVSGPGTYRFVNVATASHISDTPILADWIDAPLPPGLIY
ncbi:MAG TPA: hypothetical protein VM889_06625 [Candidatus Thermoplasmatota archaeon]|nr:hypothetical protein [Candidatus Thermoplasmatota archaeon]